MDMQDGLSQAEHAEYGELANSNWRLLLLGAGYAPSYGNLCMTRMHP